MLNQDHARLMQIARGIFTGNIFTHLHLRRLDDLGMVFMLAPLVAFSQMSEEELNDIGLIFEDMSKAGPRSVNGYPMFLSLQLLNKHDAKIVLDAAEAMQKATEKVCADFA